MDPHTAVAYGVYKKYVEETNDNTYSVILSTASPFKFNQTICKALNIECDLDEFKNILNISKLTGVSVDERILKLKETQLDRTIWDLNNTYSNLKEIVGALE